MKGSFLALPLHIAKATPQSPRLHCTLQSSERCLTLYLLIYESNSFSIHYSEGTYFFLFHKENFFVHYWIIVQKGQLLSESASLVVEGETCPSLAHQFHQNSF